MRPDQHTAVIFLPFTGRAAQIYRMYCIIVKLSIYRYTKVLEEEASLSSAGVFLLEIYLREMQKTGL